MIEVPNEGVPVYRVQLELGDSTVKTLHRNMLLPFSVIPSCLDLGLFCDSLHSETSKPLHKQSKPVQEPESESDSSDSETE